MYLQHLTYTHNLKKYYSRTYWTTVIFKILIHSTIFKNQHLGN